MDFKICMTPTSMTSCRSLCLQCVCTAATLTALYSQLAISLFMSQSSKTPRTPIAYWSDEEGDRSPTEAFFRKPISEQRSQWLQQHHIPVGDLCHLTLLQERGYQEYQAYQREVAISKSMLFQSHCTDITPAQGHSHIYQFMEREVWSSLG